MQVLLIILSIRIKLSILGLQLALSEDIRLSKAQYLEKMRAD